MRQLFSRLLAVALLLVACSGAVWGDGLKVTITKSDGTQNTKTGQESMEKALEGYFLQGIIGVEVSAGSFETDDWIWLQSHTWYLGRLEKFEVTGGIGNVADIPDMTWWDGSYFSRALKELHVAKLKRVGGYALQGLDRLTSVSLPAATEIGEWAFSGCSKLASLELGATPPSVESYAFLKCPQVRKLKLLDAGGSPLTGDALANAKSRYRAVEDGDTEDNLWYVWAFENAPASNLSGTIEGDAFANAASLEAAMKDKDLSKVKEVTITGGWFQLLDWLFLLEKGQQGLAIEKFTIESSVDRVADMPDLPDVSPRYLPKAQKVSIAKLKRVGKKAFTGCTGLTSVSLPAAKVIGYGAFGFCNAITSVSLPAATEIGSGAFGFCNAITSVSLPVAIEIGDRAFYGCAGLTSLELGATPPSVKLNAFLGCPLVRKLKLLDADGTPLTGGALTNAISRYRAVEDGETEDNLWYVWAFEDAPASNLSGTIEGDAFTNAASLEAAMKDKDLNNVKEVTITGGRFQHSDWLFLLEKGQHGLAIEKFTIESSVDRVADMPDLPYESARYLPKAQQVSIAKLKRVGEDAFYACESLKSVLMPAATEIGQHAFEDCKGLTSVSLPAATVIGWSAFEDCKGLTSVSLPMATKIGNEAFSGCTGLTSVSLPMATKIGNEAFSGCTGLTSISLPVATEIGERAFKSCNSLTSLQLGATPPSVKLNAFLGCPLVRKLKLLDADGSPLTGDALVNARSRYRAVEDGDTEDNLWYGWAFEDFPAGNLSGTIDGVAFSGATSLHTAMQGKDLSKVKEVTITGGRFQLLDWLFLLEKGQQGLAIEKFTIESSVDRVADMPDLPFNSPQYLPKAQKVSIAKLKRVGEDAFYGCTGLTSVSLPAAKEIGKDAFYGCTGLTSVSLPAATKIDGSAFEDCKGLTSVSLPGATMIVGSAFRDCKGLTSVSLPAATLIGRSAFRDCKGLTSVSLPMATKIGNEAFNGCTGLTSLQLGATPPRVGSDVFVGCPGVRTLIITDGDGVPLVGAALSTAANAYDGYAGDPIDGKWKGFAIEMNPPTLLLVKIVPSGAGTVKITRKKDGATVNQGDVLVKGDVLEVQAEPKNGYRVKAISAEGAKKIGEGNEWQVTALTGVVTFTVEFDQGQEGYPTPVESELLARARPFPNPTDGQVTIDAGTTIVRCEVYGSTGALLQTVEVPENVFTIDLTASPSGVYLVRLVDMQGGSKTLRVVKQ